jgi:hypothetical protein
MPRLDRGIQYAVASPYPIDVSGILDRPVKPGDDSGVDLARTLLLFRTI